MSQPEEIRSIIWEEWSKTGLDAETIKELKSSMSSRSSQPSSSPVKNSGIRKMSLTKGPSGSPMKRASQRSTEDIRGSSSQNEKYEFDFGKHFGRTIEEVMECNKEYFDWMFSPAATDLLDTRPNLVDGLRALPSTFLDAHSWLRDMMEQRGIPPLNMGQPVIQEGRNSKVHFWQATNRDIFFDKNTGPEVTLEDLDALFEGRSEPVLDSFTGVIVRVEAPVGDHGLEQPYHYTMIPSGWPRKTTMQMKFFDDDEMNYLTDDNVQDMLYQPFRMTGKFAISVPYWNTFKPQHDPEPTEAETGVCWRITGYVDRNRTIDHRSKTFRALRIKARTGDSKIVYVEDESAVFIEDKGTFYCFKGIIKPSDCDGILENARYIAETWEQVAKPEE